MSNEGKDGGEHIVSKDHLPADIEHMLVVGVVIDRMEELHHKLCTSFRQAVKTAFSVHGDVLDAGGAVQVCLYILYILYICVCLFASLCSCLVLVLF